VLPNTVRRIRIASVCHLGCDVFYAADLRERPV
jgi:hypothetical protein